VLTSSTLPYKNIPFDCNSTNATVRNIMDETWLLMLGGTTSGTRKPAVPLAEPASPTADTVSGLILPGTVYLLNREGSWSTVFYSL
jgi:hypothetical protein